MYTQGEDGDLILVEKPESDAVDWTPGGSGLVSTAGDYMRFALMLWNGGSYDGARILSPESVELMTRPHVRSGPLEEEGIAGVGWGLGLAVVLDDDATPLIDRNGDFWWSGYYGTNFLVSPEAGCRECRTHAEPARPAQRPTLRALLRTGVRLLGTLRAWVGVAARSRDCPP